MTVFSRPSTLIPELGRNLLINAAKAHRDKQREVEAAIAAVKKLYPHLFRKDSQS